MKTLIILLSIILFGCEQPKQVYETEIKTYVISKVCRIEDNSDTYYYIYFQTPTSTEKTWVNIDTYNKYKVGDTIQVLIKYWEKPKRK
jgi:hypothetical protein